MRNGFRVERVPIRGAVLQRALFGLPARSIVRQVGPVLALLAWSVATGAAGPSPVLYNRDIRPILSENCFPCHGPDRNKRQANLRLDVREEALARGAIVPGKPQQSRLIARITAADPAGAMPPPAFHKQLTTAQKDLLRRWVA